MTEPITPSAESLLAAALDYHARGWSVIPMAVTFDGDDGPGEKKPARKWKPYQSRRATEATLRRWCADPRVNGIAVVFGPISGGLLARDYDKLAEYKAWADAYPELAATLPTMATRRGRQVFAIAAPGSIESIRRELGKSSGTGAIKIGDGELRAGVGCYSVLPPSPHPSGIVAYRWLIPPGESIPIVDIRDCGFFVGGQSVTHTTTTTTTPPPTPILTTHPYPSHVSDGGIEATITVAIEASLPRQIGERHYCIFYFARLLKAIPSFAGAPADNLKAHIERWYSTALPTIGTKEWDTTWLDFRGAWNGVKYPAGREALASALAWSDRNEPPAVALDFGQPALRRLIALCAALQRVNGDAPFFVACRPVGERLGVHLDTVAEWLRKLCAAGIIELVTPHQFTGRPGQGRAAEYKFLPPL